MERNQHLATEAPPLTEVQKKFLEAYKIELAAELEKNPSEYAWPASRVPEVAEKMVRAMISGGANFYSNPIKRTCKKLGVKHGVRSIMNHLAAK